MVSHETENMTKKMVKNGVEVGEGRGERYRKIKKTLYKDWVHERLI